MTNVLKSSINWMGNGLIMFAPINLSIAFNGGVTKSSMSGETIRKIEVDKWFYAAPILGIVSGAALKKLASKM